MCVKSQHLILDLTCKVKLLSMLEKCPMTQKMFELIQSWSNPKCQISSNLSLFNNGIVLIQTAGTFILDKFRFASFSTMELNLDKEWELSCWINSGSLVFTHRIECIHTQLRNQRAKQGDWFVEGAATKSWTIKGGVYKSPFHIQCYVLKGHANFSIFLNALNVWNIYCTCKFCGVWNVYCTCKFCGVWNVYCTCKFCGVALKVMMQPCVYACVCMCVKFWVLHSLPIWKCFFLKRRKESLSEPTVNWK